MPELPGLVRLTLSAILQSLSVLDRGEREELKQEIVIIWRLDRYNSAHQLLTDSETQSVQSSLLPSRQPSDSQVTDLSIFNGESKYCLPLTGRSPLHLVSSSLFYDTGYRYDLMQIL